ncbi:arginine deiminase [Candidatus Saccharibacteria bacterium]|nr:MAG: arginine deiminase [Candidatus Saccharibacteria bacterium]
MDQPIHITSEIGKLKTVILHRPGEELENLTPDYLTNLLFDDIPYLKVAQEEHDAFAEALRSRGVEVLYLDQLATEAIDNDELREKFVDDMLANSKQGSRRVTSALKEFLLDLPTHAMVRKIMSGVRKDEITLPPEHHQQLHNMIHKDRYPFYLNPMPNLYFTRDPAAAIGNGLTINRMHWSARRRESLFMRYIIDHHPRFAGKNVPVWYDREEEFSMEGGDELVLSKDTMAIGISERTTAEAVETMATKLFAGSDFKKIIAMEIPKSHAFMHLDTVFTMIDYDKFTIHPEIRDRGGKINCYILEKVEGQDYPKISLETDLPHVLRSALNLSEVHLIECGGGDPIAAAREQWNDGSNTLAIAPGVVVTYDRNYVTNQKLREIGVEVIEVSGSELGRGRGGPRCMSMPIVREDI